MAGTSASLSNSIEDELMTASAQDPIDQKRNQNCTKLSNAVQSLDREATLSLVGHPCPTASRIGDIPGLSALLLPSVLKIAQCDVPWLHAGSGAQCPGTKIYRCNRHIASICPMLYAALCGRHMLYVMFRNV